MNTTIRLHRALWYMDATEFVVMQRTTPDSKSWYIAEPLKMTTCTPGSIIEPTFRLSDIECQYLVNQLHQIGFRPSDGKWLNNETQALKAHLEDMRTIVESKLKVILKHG